MNALVVNTRPNAITSAARPKRILFFFMFVDCFVAVEKADEKVGLEIVFFLFHSSMTYLFSTSRGGLNFCLDTKVNKKSRLYCLPCTRLAKLKWRNWNALLLHAPRHSCPISCYYWASVSEKVSLPIAVESNKAVGSYFVSELLHFKRDRNLFICLFGGRYLLRLAHGAGGGCLGIRDQWSGIRD